MYVHVKHYQILYTDMLNAMNLHSKGTRKVDHQQTYSQLLIALPYCAAKPAYTESRVVGKTSFGSS